MEYPTSMRLYGYLGLLALAGCRGGAGSPVEAGLGASASSQGGGSSIATAGTPMGGVSSYTAIAGGTTFSTGGAVLGSGGTNAKGGTSANGGQSVGGSLITFGSSSTGGNAAAGAAACSVPPAPSMLVGWAAVAGNNVTTTTGGGNVAPVTVSTLEALQAAVMGTNAAVIYVTGTLAPGVIAVGSNKTIAGICGAELHGHLGLNGSVNVIIRNIKIVGYAVGDCALDPTYDAALGCSSGEDTVSVMSGAHHVWFDHCDISDGTDGNLDITSQSNYVTVSWTKFHYTARTDPVGSDSTGTAGHRYSNLVGGDDAAPDSGFLNVTWHHCWWADRVHERQPRVRFGKNHLFNNLWTSSGDNYCIRAGINAQLLIEYGVFSAVKNPQVFNSTSDQTTAYITATGNIYTGTSGTQATAGGGTPFATAPYDYASALEAASAVQASVQNGAGPK